MLTGYFIWDGQGQELPEQVAVMGREADGEGGDLKRTGSSLIDPFPNLKYEQMSICLGS